MTKKQLPEGLFEDAEFRRCQQTQCAFFRIGGCKPCAECAAAPFNIRKSCQRCDSCENCENSLRWDDAMSKAIGVKKVISVVR
jgi:hypothetical protein